MKTLPRLANLADSIDATASAEDCARSKPDPDILTAVLARLALPAEHVVMLGTRRATCEPGK